MWCCHLSEARRYPQRANYVNLDHSFLTSLRTFSSFTFCAWGGRKKSVWGWVRRWGWVDDAWLLFFVLFLLLFPLLWIFSWGLWYAKGKVYFGRKEGYKKTYRVCLSVPKLSRIPSSSTFITQVLGYIFSIVLEYGKRKIYIGKDKSYEKMGVYILFCIFFILTFLHLFYRTNTRVIRLKNCMIFDGGVRGETC